MQFNLDLTEEQARSVMTAEAVAAGVRAAETRRREAEEAASKKGGKAPAKPPAKGMETGVSC